MQNFLSLLLEHESELYVILFFVTLALVVLVEERVPKRPLKHSVKTRWRSNITLGIANNFLANWFIPTAAIITLYFTEQAQWGLMYTLELPYWIEVFISLLFLDLLRYLVHRLFHRVPLLWRLHRLHHTDLDVDFSTQFRFHPLETFVSAAITLPVLVLFAPAMAAILIHKFVFVITSFFVHSNTALPAKVEPYVGLVFTTPDIHKVHHSTALCESNANFGALFSFWDRLLGTFVAQPKAGSLAMPIGVKEMQNPKHLQLGWMLLNPFLSADNDSLDTGSTTRVSKVTTSSSEADLGSKT